MKSPDKFLLGIVVGVVALVGAAFALVLTRPAPTYQSDDTPEGALHNYLLALQTSDYERAYRYLSPELSGYPTTLENFRQEVSGVWGFAFDEVELRVLPDQTRLTDAQAVVTLQIRHLGSRGPLAGDSVTTQTFTWQRQENTWQLIAASGYLFWNYWEWGREE